MLNECICTRKSWIREINARKGSNIGAAKAPIKYIPENRYHFLSW